MMIRHHRPMKMEMMMDLNQAALLLTLCEVVQAGIKRHFRAAVFGEPTTMPALGHASFKFRVLSQPFEITIYRLKSDTEINKV